MSSLLLRSYHFRTTRKHRLEASPKQPSIAMRDPDPVSLHITIGLSHLIPKVTLGARRRFPTLSHLPSLTYNGTIIIRDTAPNGHLASGNTTY
jgi:hypothetical protein